MHTRCMHARWLWSIRKKLRGRAEAWSISRSWQCMCIVCVVRSWSDQMRSRFVLGRARVKFSRLRGGPCRLWAQGGRIGGLGFSLHFDKWVHGRKRVWARPESRGDTEADPLSIRSEKRHRTPFFTCKGEVGTWTLSGAGMSSSGSALRAASDPPNPVPRPAWRRNKQESGKRETSDEPKPSSTSQPEVRCLLTKAESDERLDNPEPASPASPKPIPASRMKVSYGIFRLGLTKHVLPRWTKKYVCSLNPLSSSSTLKPSASTSLSFRYAVQVLVFVVVSRPLVFSSWTRGDQRGCDRSRWHSSRCWLSFVQCQPADRWYSWPWYSILEGWRHGAAKGAQRRIILRNPFLVVAGRGFF